MTGFDMMSQVRELQERNAELMGQLEQRDAEVTEMRSAMDDMASMQRDGVNAGKVMDLAKRNRALNLMVEREKRKVEDLERLVRTSSHQARDAARVPADDVEAAARSVVEEAAEAAAEAQKEAAAWKEKFERSASTMGQLQQRVAVLEAERKKLERVIAQEVGGEGVTVAQLLEAGDRNGWRGRAQQISLLKEQVKELKQAAGKGAAAKKHEEGHRSHLARLSAARLQEMEELTAMVATMTEQQEVWKKKVEAAVSRKAIVENDAKLMKERLQVLLSKSSNDDRLVAALREEVADLKQQVAAQKRGDVAKLRQQLAAAAQQIDRQEQIVRALYKQLSLRRERDEQGKTPS